MATVVNDTPETEELFLEWISRLTVQKRRELLGDRWMVVASNFKASEAGLVEEIILATTRGEGP